MIPLEPMIIGAAASALPRVIEALPKPGEFMDMLREVFTGEGSPEAIAPQGNSASFAAQKQQAYEGLSSWIRDGLESLSLSGLSEELNEKIDQFRTALDQIFDKNGIDRSNKILLRIDGMGKAQVQGERADAVKIEALFEQYPELRDQLAAIDVMARFGHLQSDKSAPSTTMAIGKDSFDILFD